MNKMYELLTSSGNLVSFDLDKLVWVKSCLPEFKIHLHFDCGNDLIVNVNDGQTAQALVADISQKKSNYITKEESIERE